MRFPPTQVETDKSFNLSASRFFPVLRLGFQSHKTTNRMNCDLEQSSLNAANESDSFHLFKPLAFDL
jgi:hypothetical protein